MRHARKHPTLTVRRSATCLMVRSRGAVPIECDCPIDFFITPPVRIASRILSRSRRAAFDSDPAQAAASRDNGQHWLRPSVLGTPWRDHPPQQQLSANTRATFDENRLGRPQADLALRTPNTCIGSSSSVLRLVQPSGQHAPLPLGYELTSRRLQYARSHSCRSSTFSRPAVSPRPASSHRFRRVPCSNPWPPHRHVVLQVHERAAGVPGVV